MGSFGTGIGQFGNPHALATDAAGNLYVADFYNYPVQVFGPAPTPTFTQSWGEVKARYLPGADAATHEK